MPLNAVTATELVIAAAADSVSDVTPVIQAALDTGALAVRLPPAGGSYMISAPLTLKAGQRLICRGAKVKALAAKSGLLLTAATHFIMPDDAAIEGLNIRPPAGSYSLDSGYHTIVKLLGSRGALEGVTIDATGAVLADAIEGFRVTGAVDGNRIVGVRLFGCEGVYGDLGTRFTTVRDFYSKNAPANGLRGAASDSARDGYGHVIDGFTIINPGRMGIEDYCRAVTSGTASNPTPALALGARIANGTIEGGASAQYYAISAVAQRPHVDNVHIINWPNGYAIELSDNVGATVTNSTIEWTDGNPNNVDGIQVQQIANATGSAVPLPGGGTATSGAAVDFLTPTIIANNTFRSPRKGVVARSGFARITGNTFYDYKVNAVYSEGAASGRRLQLIGNSAIALTPAAATRTAFACSQYTIAIGNDLRWAAPANGGAGTDIGFQCAVDGSIFLGNVFQNDGVASASAVAPIGYTSNGTTPANVTIADSRVTAGTVSMTLANMVTPRIRNLVGFSAISGSGVAVEAFFAANPVAKPAVTGAKGSNAALGSLITQLATLGLITDSSSA